MWSKFKEKAAAWFCKRAGKEACQAAPEWLRDLVDCLDEPLKNIPVKMAKHGPIVDQSLMEIITRHVNSLGSYGPLIARCLKAFQSEFNPKKGD